MRFKSLIGTGDIHMHAFNANPRYILIPMDGAITDLFWSDPEEEAVGWMISPRGAGVIWGADKTKDFLNCNGLKKIIRSHQMVMEVRQKRIPQG